jgi:hypothetical protein
MKEKERLPLQARGSKARVDVPEARSLGKGATLQTDGRGKGARVAREKKLKRIVG